MSEDVSVPVLSKQQTSTLPPKGTRKGSMQYIPARMSCNSESVTASDIVMGNSGGTTSLEISKWRENW